MNASKAKASPAWKFGQGAGASPLFPPEHSEPEAAKAALLVVVRRDPRQLGKEQSRWTLAALLECCPFLHTSSTSTLWHLLDRLGISYQRGRDYIHSPDPEYLEKLAYRDALLQRVRTAAERGEGRERLLFLDEFTYYRHPTLASDWSERDPAPSAEVLARRSPASNTTTRVAATLDLLDARVCLWQGSRFGIEKLVGFYRQVHEAYPAAQRLWIVQDNWPVHFHPDVLCALEAQQDPFARRLPKAWPSQPSRAAQARWGDWQLPIQVVALPTYASWLNPIEKLWRFLKQKVLHLHRLSAELPELRARVRAFLAQFDTGSKELLHYVGLPPRCNGKQPAARSAIPAQSEAVLAA